MDKFPNILLAEDDVDDYLFFVEALEKISPYYRVTRAKNGHECITLLKKSERPDIVFLDLNMPVKNGLECLKLIKENELFADIPVIIYSTSHYIKDIDACFKNGAHYFIIKPASDEALLTMLTKVIGRLNKSVAPPVKENFVIGVNGLVESKNY